VAQVRAPAHPLGDAGGSVRRQNDAEGGAERPTHAPDPGAIVPPGVRAPVRAAYEPVKTAIHDMATAPGFRETLRALEKTQFEDGAAITVPVIVAFGSPDRVLLPKVARRRDQLPDQTRWVTLSECGHIPMFDDPEATADLLLQASDPATAGTLGEPVRQERADVAGWKSATRGTLRSSSTAEASETAAGR